LKVGKVELALEEVEGLDGTMVEELVLLLIELQTTPSQDERDQHPSPRGIGVDPMGNGVKAQEGTGKEGDVDSKKELAFHETLEESWLGEEKEQIDGSHIDMPLERREVEAKDEGVGPPPIGTLEEEESWRGGA